MDPLKVKGVLLKKFEKVKLITNKGNKTYRQHFLIETEDFKETIFSKKSSKLYFDVFGEEKIKDLSNFNIGDDVEVLFYLRSYLYNGNYFHNLNTFQIRHFSEPYEPSPFEQYYNNYSEQDFINDVFDGEIISYRNWQNR